MDTESGASGLWSGVKSLKFTNVTGRLVGPVICLQEVILLDCTAIQMSVIHVRVVAELTVVHVLKP
jgi:hypothetical protein